MEKSMTASINNYTIGKGIVYFKKDGDPDYVDMGNCSEFEFTPEIEKLDHFSSREGVRQKDKTVVIQASGTLRLVLDEWSIENLKLAVLGSSALNSAGANVIQIFDQNSIKGSVKFVNTNDVGPQYEYIFSSVDFIPSSSLALISDEWGTIELTGECAAVNGSFGTITELNPSA
jgi:hypothetical protein